MKPRMSLWDAATRQQPPPPPPPKVPVRIYTDTEGRKWIVYDGGTTTTTTPTMTTA